MELRRATNRPPSRDLEAEHGVPHQEALTGQHWRVADQDTVTAGRESLSQFLARVLAQMSVSAWLPALMSTAIILVLANLAISRGDLAQAFANIGSIGAAGIIFLVAGVVVLTLFTQAFEFDAIRALEGYWRRTGLIGRFTAWRCRRHRSRKSRLAGTRSRLATEAVRSAREGLREHEGAGNGVMDALESIIALKPQIKSTSDVDIDAAFELTPKKWKRYADPGVLAEHQAVGLRLDEYPKDGYRVLPTTLGNVIRAAEDQIKPKPGRRLETYVMHVRDEAPATLVRNYDEQRRRLDLYCGLVFVFALAVPAATGIALSFPPRPELVAVGIGSIALMAVGVIASYRAALSTARKFGLVLLALRDHEEAPSTASPVPQIS